MDQSRGKQPWSSANQEQTLVTRGRLLEDPAESVKHVLGMSQSWGIPLREGEPILVSWPKQSTSNAQQTGARQYTHGQVLPISSSYSSKA